jgi:hypothetical protein
MKGKFSRQVSQRGISPQRSALKLLAIIAGKIFRHGCKSGLSMRAYKAE